MKYPASEKLEIIRLVERSHLSVRRTLDKLGVSRPTFYRRQILINLLSNAFKFTDRDDKVVVDAGVMTNGAVYFQVSDTGIGMSPEEVEIALAMFGQVDSGMGRNYEGSGLGLPLCKSLVEAHGGTLEIESKPGIGTKVRVIFPPERVVADTGVIAKALPQE